MSTFDDRLSKAYDLATDLVKQLITLSTGVLTLTLAFYTDFLQTSSGPTTLMVASWIVLVVSILAGIVGLMGLTGSLASGSQTILTLQQQIFPAIQFILFVLGMALMVWAVVASSTT